MGTLFGRRVVLLLGELLMLPFVHVAHPFPSGLGRRADARIIGRMAVTQGMHVRSIQFDPSA